MKLVRINPSNMSYYSRDFIKGFECGAKRQLEADKRSIPKGHWIDIGDYAVCSNCKAKSGIQYDGVEPIPLETKYCPRCGADMKGEDND